MSLRRLVGFGRGWRGGSRVAAVESECRAPDGPPVAVTTFALPGAHHAPAWIGLHGITVPGRAHPSLVQFARAMAASGSVVVIPEVSEWMELRLGTTESARVVAACLDLLEADPRTVGSPGLVGFSFGGPQVIRIAGDAQLGPRLAGVASFGGFAELESTLRFQLTGRIPTADGDLRVHPDPYGRWIMAANYLPAVGGGEELAPVAAALRRLALEAGRRRTTAWDQRYDPLKAKLEAELPSAESRALFRLFAPPFARDPEALHPEVESWTTRLSEAARRQEPGLEVPQGIELHAPAHILHGRSDTLIPFTEAAALAARIGSPRPTHTVTGLFAHSGRGGGRGIGAALESVRLANALRRVLQITNR